MRRLGALILLLGLSAPAVAADPPAEEQPSVPWYRWLFLGERPKPAPAPTVGAARPAAAKPAAPSKEDVTRALDQEQKVYVQRLAAVSKLRQIAEDRGDDELIKKADDLERQADEVFRQRTARLQAAGIDDRAALERGRDAGGASADAAKRRNPRGGNR
jgi:hypothetical protein